MSSYVHCKSNNSKLSIPRDYAGVKIYPAITTAALNQKKDKELVFWYLLRTANVNNNGRIDQEKAQQIFTEYFNYSKRTFQRHLRLGDGLFWNIRHVCDSNGEIRRSVIKIYGLKSLIEYFGAYTPTRPVILELATIIKYGHKPALWNASAYKPFMAKSKNNPRSREALEQVTGIKRRKQQRWDKKANTKKAPTEQKEYDPKTHKVFTPKRIVETSQGIIAIPMQKGNIYTSHATATCKGMLKRVCKSVKRSNESLITDEATHTNFNMRPCYFDTFSNALKAISNGVSDSLNTFYHLKSNNVTWVRVLV